MSFEDRLRASMRSRAERAEASADAYDRIVRRVEAPVRRPRLAPALAVGGLAAVAALAVVFVAGDRNPDELDVAAGSGSIPVADIRPIWPVTDASEFEAMQRRVDRGEEEWLLDAEAVVREYLAAHEMTARIRRARADDRVAVGDELARYPDAVAVGYLGGWVELARAERADRAMWFVVGAHDSRIPIVDARKRGARVDVDFDAIVADVVVTARAGTPARHWLAETTVDLRAGRSQRLVLDVGHRAPELLLVQIRTTGHDDFVGLTELLVSP